MKKKQKTKNVENGMNRQSAVIFAMSRKPKSFGRIRK